MAVKSALKIIGYIFAFVISSIIILAFLIDANTFKPRIQSLAQDYGIALSMRGDLHWAFWPAIGLAANEVSIADTNAPQKIIADVKKASFLIAFVPLMQGDFQVKHILVDGAVIDLEVNEQGVGNWENLIKKKDNPAAASKPKSTTQVSADDLKLSIEKISLHNSDITYNNLMSGQKLALRKISLDMDDVNLKGNPFEVDFSSETEISQLKTKSTAIQLKNKLHTTVTIGEGFNSLAFGKSKLNLDIHTAESASVNLEFSITLDNVKNNLRYRGNVLLPSTNVKQLMNAFGVKHKTANEKALTDVSFGGDFDGDKKRFMFTSATIQVDKTHLKGLLGLKDFSTKSLVVDLQADQLNLDDYLAPKTVGQPVAANNASGDEPLIPVDMLRTLSVDAKLNFASFNVIDLALQKALLTVDSQNGVLHQQLNATAYTGNIHQKMDLDSRGKNAQLQFEAVLQGIEIAPILQAKKLDKNVHLSGVLQANTRAQTTGITKNQLLEALVGNANFSGAKIRLAPINLEQQFCKFIDLVNRTDEPTKTWNAYTELRELTGKITIAKRIITVEGINAGIEKLLLSSTGTINLVNGNYDFSLPLKLVRDATDTPTSITTSAQGCKVTSNYWAERSMSLLRCKGAYADINPTSDCRVDKDMLNAVVKDFAEYKLKEKHGEKIEAKKTQLLKKLDDKLGGEGNGEKAKDLLKNLFKKKNDQ